MAIKDKIKWDKKYQETPRLLEERNPCERLIIATNKTTGKKALDIACGAGKNSIYLAKQDFDVDAMDISKVALDTLNNKGYKNINANLVDLEGYKPQQNIYDLIVMTNYLDREIIPLLALALKKDGILFIETYMQHENNQKPNSNPNFLLKKEELKSFFDENFEVLDYDEFENEEYELYRMMKQAITVKKR